MYPRYPGHQGEEGKQQGPFLPASGLSNLSAEDTIFWRTPYPADFYADFSPPCPDRVSSFQPQPCRLFPGFHRQRFLYKDTFPGTTVPEAAPPHPRFPDAGSMLPPFSDRDRDSAVPLPVLLPTGPHRLQFLLWKPFPGFSIRFVYFSLRSSPISFYSILQI